MAQPKLRFKREDGTEFPNWEDTSFGDTCSGFEYGMNTAACSYDGMHKYIRITDIDDTSRRYLSENAVSPNGNMQDKYIVNVNDILFARTGASVGKAYLYRKSDGLLYYAGFLIRVNVNDDNNAYFIFSQTLTSDYNNWVKLTSMRTGQQGINAQEYKCYKFYAPCLEEQQKIADFLSTVDEVIAQSEAEVQNLEQQKKAAMQKIFSQEIRFRRGDGKEFPEWEESTLGRECDFINGKAHENCEAENGRYIIVNSKFISTNGEVKRKTNTILERLYIDDIVMVMSDVPNGKAMSKCFVIKENDKYTLNQRICALRTKHNSMYISNQISRCKYFMLFDDGVKQTNLRKQDVLECPISIPCLEEQQKIADFLSAYDEAISYAKQELDKWKELKKGLLQQMFV